MTFHTLTSHSEKRRKGIGLVLVNLGTPDAPTPSAVRRYLREFLSDQRVIELPKFLWQIILNFIILPIRSPKSAKNYAKIWDYEHGDSPIRYHLEQLTKKIANETTIFTEVVPAMRYGNPSIAKALSNLLEKKADKIIILPLYPQYCAATTASCYDAVFYQLKKMRWAPSIYFLSPYYDHPNYIRIISDSVKKIIESDAPEVTLCSFHGMPERTLPLGDPYYCHSHKTARLIREQLGLDETKFRFCFQSRFGPAKWFGPSVEEVLSELASQGIKKIAVVAPGFSMDCIETLEEIAIGYKEFFIEAGGEELIYIPCINSSDEAIDFYKSFIHEQLNYDIMGKY